MKKKKGKGGGRRKEKSMDRCKGHRRWREGEKIPTTVPFSLWQTLLQSLLFLSVTRPPVLQHWFHDRDRVVLQVVVDLHIPDTIILIGRLVHRLLEVGIKSKHLQEKRMLSVVVPDMDLISRSLHHIVWEAWAPVISLL